MKIYNDGKPPQRGTGRKIYQAFKARGFEVWDLHYNPNLWGMGATDGWGTWACSISDERGSIECWCGWDNERGAYLQNTGAPFNIVFLSRGNE